MVIDGDNGEDFRIEVTGDNFCVQGESVQITGGGSRLLKENLKRNMRRWLAALMAAALTLPSGALPALAEGNAGVTDGTSLEGGAEPAGYVLDGVYDGWKWDTGTAQGEDTVCEITADGWLHTNGSGSNEAPAVFVNPNSFDFTKPGYFEYDLQSIYSEKFGVYFDYGDPGYGLLFGYDNGGWYYQKYGGDYSWTPVADRKAKRPEEGETVHVRVSWNGDGTFSLRVDDIQAFTNEPSTLETHQSSGRIGIACYNANVKLEHINYSRDGIDDGYRQDEVTVKSDDAVCERTEDGWLHLKGGTGNGADAKDPALYPAVFVNPFPFDFTEDGYFQFDMEQISDANTKFGVYLNYEKPDQAILFGYDGGGWYWELYHGDGTSDWYDGERVAAPGEGGKKNVQITWTADGAFYLFVDGEKVFSDAFRGLDTPEYQSGGKAAFSCSGATDVKVRQIFSTRDSAALTGLTVSPAEQVVSTAKDPVRFETGFKNMIDPEAKVTWESANPKVARINREGEIILVGAGDARVTATAELLGRQVSVSALLTYAPDGSEEEAAYLAANQRPFLQEDLRAAVEDAKADYDAGQGKYTDESWNAFKAAYESAAADGAADSDNETLKALTAALKEARAQLAEPVPVDKSKIDDMLKYIRTNMLEIPGGPGYTAESKKALEDAKEEAERVRADEDATQEEVDEAVRKLKEAFDHLEPIVIPPEVTAAKEALYRALEAAEPVYQAGRGEYTAESWTAFENAFLEARRYWRVVLADAGELNGVVAALVHAQKNLAKPVPPEDKTDPPVNQNPAPPSQNPDVSAASVRKGDVIVSGKLRYQVTDAAKKTVELVKGVNQKSVVIPATVTQNGIKFKVTAIGAGAFKGFGRLANVTIGKHVKTIGRQSFYNCKKLGKIVRKGSVL